jgi:hypothetical protein
MVCVCVCVCVCVLQAEAIVELLEACSRTTYFQVDGKFFQQKDGKLPITHH